MTDNSTGFDLDLQYPGFRQATGQIESGGNPRAVTGSNRGLYQWGPPEERQYGISNWLDPAQQNSALDRESASNYRALSGALGRPPTASELYLAHQQGQTGARALLTAAPDQPAWMAVRPYYRSDAMAQKAITGNIPSNHYLFGANPNQVSAGDFRGLWDARYNRTPYGPGTPAGNYAVAGGPTNPSAPGAGMAPVAGVVAQYQGAGGTPAPATSPGTGAPAPQDQAAPPAASPTGASPGGGTLASEAAGLMQPPELQAPPPLTPLPPNLARLRNAIAGRTGFTGAAMPPTVAQRIAALMGRTT